jgi:prophage tail gpP-like protein
MGLTLKITNGIKTKTVEFFNDFEFELMFNSVASPFSFSFLFDPTNSDHKELIQPFNTVVLEHTPEGKTSASTVITGMIIKRTLGVGSNKRLAHIGGYSLTGQLEDSTIPQSAYPLQSNQLSLEALTTKLIEPFGLSLVVDPEVLEVVKGKFKATTADSQQSVKDYLHELAKQKDVWLSHNELGQLLLTKAKTTAAPIFDFDLDSGTPQGTDFELDSNFQAMHRTITAQKQASTSKGSNAGQASVINPYVPEGVLREITVSQTSGEEGDTALVARRARANELRGISLKIELNKWDINSVLILPNNTIDVKGAELNLDKKTRFFIESVSYKGNSTEITCKPRCVVPEVYNQEEPKNIFNDINQNRLDNI